jgi:hypothetical protein
MKMQAIAGWLKKMVGPANLLDINALDYQLREALTGSLFNPGNSFYRSQ